MATVTVFTAERMQEIEDGTVVSGAIVGDDLILTKHDGSTVNAGVVVGPEGPPGSDSPIDGKFYLRKDGAWVPTSSFPGSLIAYKEYDPDPAVSVAATTQALVDIDATNLAVTFVAPASGKVLVELEAVAGINNDQNACIWGLREAAAKVGSTAIAYSVGADGGTTATVCRVRCSFPISGLVAGSSHTYKWAHLSSNISGGKQATTSYGHTGATDLGGIGAAIMKVKAL